MSIWRLVSILKLSALLYSLVFAPAASAHESRPLYVEIVEQQPAVYRVDWKAPPTIPVHNLPVLQLPEGCESVGAGGQRQVYTARALYRCDAPISGRELTIQYPGYNPSVSSMIKLQTLKGEAHLGLLGPQELAWRVPAAETASGVARHYTTLGIEHIWAGLDHLLFLVCLLWIAGDWRRVLITVTGFTVAHSLTLGASALDIIRIPVPPVEAVIALSIVFLAREIAIGRRDSLTWNFPIAVSSSFGLLHGLGFAAVLADIGLPQTARLAGLLFFNVGVEIGQVLFIGAAALGLWAAAKALKLLASQRRRNFSPDLARLSAAYGVGVVSTYWFIERVAPFVGSV